MSWDYVSENGLWITTAQGKRIFHEKYLYEEKQKGKKRVIECTQERYFKILSPESKHKLGEHFPVQSGAEYYFELKPIGKKIAVRPNNFLTLLEYSLHFNIRGKLTEEICTKKIVADLGWKIKSCYLSAEDAIDLGDREYKKLLAIATYEISDLTEVPKTHIWKKRAESKIRHSLHRSVQEELLQAYAHLD